MEKEAVHSRLLEKRVCGARLRKGGTCKGVQGECAFHAPEHLRCKSTLDEDPRKRCYSYGVDYCPHHEAMPNLCLRVQEYGMECASKGGACSPREVPQEYFPGQEKLPVLDFLKYVRSVSERPSLYARAASVNLDLSEENSPLRVRAAEGAYVIDHGKYPVMCVRV